MYLYICMAYCVCYLAGLKGPPFVCDKVCRRLAINSSSRTGNQPHPCHYYPSPRLVSNELPPTLHAKKKYGILFIFSLLYMNTLPMNVYEFLSYTGFTRWIPVFIFLWLRHRNR